MCSKPDCLSSKILRAAVGASTGFAIQAGIVPRRVSLDQLEERRNKCRECPAATRNRERMHLPTKGLTSLSTCRFCKCFIMLKTQIPEERCPEGKW
jgi:hypothetical protein